MKRNLLPAALAVVAFASPFLNGRAAIYTVTSLADTPASGTLRWAIGQANANPGGTIAFDVSGTITLSSALPDLTRAVKINGATAPGFSGSPVVSIDFAGQPGLTVAKGAEGTLIQSLSLVRAGGAGITLRASRVTIDSNYIGLTPSGTAGANAGDGVKIFASSRGNLIGGFNPVTGIKYFDTSDASAFKIQPVKYWQGLRNYQSSNVQFLIGGTSGDDGLIYIGPIAGGGSSYKLDFPGAATTSIYGPDELKNGNLRMVGSYTNSHNKAANDHGFIWEGTLSNLPKGGTFHRIDYPGATTQFTHSTMGGLAVGNADGPTGKGQPLGPIIAYIYDVEKATFIENIVFPGSKSNTAYGIWYNGGTSYTICGGYSSIATNNVKNPSLPLARARAFLVDYDSKTGKFSHWKSYRFHNKQSSKAFWTHFEGISSTEAGVYTLSADTVKRGNREFAQGAWVSVRRNPDGTFGGAQWVDVSYPGAAIGTSSNNSVFGHTVVGVVAEPGTTPFPFQATIQVGFKLSNVISGNKGNGISLNGSKSNIIAQNRIGTNPAGTAAIGNKKHGILLTGGASGNLIGGQEAGTNNPTGTKDNTTPVYITPPQGNLISGNQLDGVLITRNSPNNTLSGNFVGTDNTGDKPIGNGLDGVAVENSPGNSFIGCTLHQNPFVFYNVISGNGRDGIRLTNADNATVQANFLGIAADNHRILPNAGNGLTVGGSSRNTKVGGVIPLGNVISGNTKNGIAVTGTASGFISFNTFGGGFAFGDAAPNGGDGILITSTGGNNAIRTCILSGNTGNGLEIGGNASGVQVTDTACGTNTDINKPLPNTGNGILISGTAHNNFLGGAQPSIEGRTHFSGNLGYGVAVIDHAHDNFIYNSNIGIGHIIVDQLTPAIPNQLGGIYLGSGTSATTIGGNGLLKNRIGTNNGAGLAIIASTQNTITGNDLNDNTTYGIYATGACSGTTLTGNTTTGNHTGNVDISGASGITTSP